MENGVTVAYSGVHQAYQLALAADEIEKLDYFYCSIFAGTGKWGGGLSRLLGENLLHNRRIEGINLSNVKEYPWPLFWHRLRQIIRVAQPSEWEQVNIKFDSWIAKRIETSSSRVFVGAETCCAQSLEAARKKGMISVVDWPGVSTRLLNELALKAAQQFSLTTNTSGDTPVMHLRKQQEMELADVILACSDFQAQSLIDQGFPRDKIKVVPLWVDSSYWHPKINTEKLRVSKPLRVMYAGKINIRKGVPYLIQAVTDCDVLVELTLVGSTDTELQHFLQRRKKRVKLLPACTKYELRELYSEHDVFVLPSLGDSFGFVATEAMASGLPVIVTENCGAPVPSETWRVPVMDSDAIARRLKVYAIDRELLDQDGRLARQFAQRFTPEYYRKQIKTVFSELLGSAI